MKALQIFQIILVILIVVGILNADVDHTEDIEDMKADIHKFFDHIGDHGGMDMDVLEEYFTDDVFINDLGKTSSGMDQLYDFAAEIHDKHLTIHIGEYVIDPVFVYGDTGSAIIEGTREVDGETKKFIDAFSMKKEGDKWKIQAAIVFVMGAHFDED